MTPESILRAQPKPPDVPPAEYILHHPDGTDTYAYERSLIQAGKDVARKKGAVALALCKNGEVVASGRQAVEEFIENLVPASA